MWLFFCTLYYILYNKLVNVSKVFSWVLWVLELSNLRRDHRTPKGVAKLHKSVGWLGIQDLWMATEVRAVLRDWALKAVESDTDSGQLGSELNWIVGYLADAENQRTPDSRLCQNTNLQHIQEDESETDGLVQKTSRLPFSWPEMWLNACWHVLLGPQALSKNPNV